MRTQDYVHREKVTQNNNLWEWIVDEDILPNRGGDVLVAKVRNDRLNENYAVVPGAIIHHYALIQDGVMISKVRPIESSEKPALEAMLRSHGIKGEIKYVR